MADDSGISGASIAVLLAGGVLVYSAIKGVSPVKAIRSFAKGKALPPDVAPTFSYAGANVSGLGEHSGPGYTHKDFFDAVLQGIGAPVTYQNELALASVATLEGLNTRFNPLNSVVPSGNSTAFNSVGVQDYKSFNNGVAGTVALLNGSRWERVRNALQNDLGMDLILSEFTTVYQSWDPNVQFPTNPLRLQATLNTSVG